VLAHRQAVHTASAPAPIGPYSQAMVGGGFVFTVGVVGSNPATSQLVPGGLAAEARQALENLDRILDAAGSVMTAIVKCTVYLTDMGDFAAFNEIYSSKVPKPFPARTTVAVLGLPLGARVEIDCVAVADSGQA